ncbi:MAG: DUF5941 domain-containing protein [Gaiellaceae bacterium]
MTALQVYRDDGPLAAWIVGRVAAARSPGAVSYPLAWLSPPLLRVLDYGALIALTAVADADALPLCFALLGVLAFHHYDVVYRLRHQRQTPSSWVRAVGGGWDGRLLVAVALAVGGGLGIGLLVAAVGLAVVYVTESVLSWMRFARAEGPAVHEDEDEDGD